VRLDPWNGHEGANEVGMALWPTVGGDSQAGPQKERSAVSFATLRAGLMSCTPSNPAAVHVMSSRCAAGLAHAHFLPGVAAAPAKAGLRALPLLAQCCCEFEDCVRLMF